MVSPQSGQQTPTIEQERAHLHTQLSLRPDDPYLRQALLRLSSPQHIKAAARYGVFISYTGADDLFAVQVTEDLRDLGLPVFLDIADIPDSVDWHSAVETALEHCGLMITVLSPHALADDELMLENHTFLQKGKIVIPAMFETCNYKAPQLWEQPIDFRHDYALGITILTRLLSS